MCGRSASGSVTRSSFADDRIAETMPASVIVSVQTRDVRADRLLSILLLLQAHGRLSARALATRLEVSPRTVHRDMEALSMAGVPVYAATGRRGGWALLDEYRTDLTGMTETELRSLVVASVPGVLADLGLGPAADRALIKLLATLPEARRRAAEQARGYLHVDPTGWRRAEEAAPFLPTLELALRTGRRVAIEYEHAFDRQVVSRTVDPLGLVAKGSIWYLVAAVDGQPRTYRASRIRAATILDASAERPPGFDLAASWATSAAEFRAGLPASRVTVRVAPDGMGRLRAGWRYATVESEAEPDADGWSVCTIRADSVEMAAECVVSLGGSAEIVEPVELRARVLALAGAVEARHAAPEARHAAPPAKGRRRSGARPPVRGASAGDGADHSRHQLGGPSGGRRRQP
jgi:predicted DNA-binding transcriptional regulator YafY